MINTLIGKKQHMTQLFKDDGTVVPVTEISLGPCVVTQIKTQEKEGYQAIQLGFGPTKKISRPLKGHLKKSGAAPRFLREVRTEEDQEINLQVGDALKIADIFSVGDKVTVIGTSKGKGFAGVVKRWGFHGATKTHGQKSAQRGPGSIGAQGEGHVVKGKKMAGRMGTNRVTVRGLEITEIDEKNHRLKIKGAIPGQPGSLLIVKKNKS